MRLWAEAGHLTEPQALTVGDVEGALIEDRGLVELWLDRGRDQRRVGGWGINRDPNPYRIQNFFDPQRLLERDKLYPCLQFIICYVGFVQGEAVERHRH